MSGLRFLKSPTTMKTSPILTLGALFGSCLIATASDAQLNPERPNHPDRPIPPEMIKKFDKDNDGKLSPEERQAMRAKMEERQKEALAKFDKDGDGKLSEDERKVMMAEMKTKMDERRKEMIAKYDADGDGKLNEEEEKKARAARQAEMFKSYDKDGDGKLSAEERAAIPKRLEGGPDHAPGAGGAGHRPGAAGAGGDSAPAKPPVE